MVIDSWAFAYVIKNLQEEQTILKYNLTGKCFFYHIAVMQQLHDHIFDVINKLWSDKRQLNENSVYNHILKTVEFLTAIQLEAGAVI